MKRLLARVLGGNLTSLARLEVDVLRVYGVRYSARWHALLADAWVRDRLFRRRYRLLDAADLRARRRSDTVFVFGSGWSLNELAPDEWGHFREHDVFGFNAFYEQRWVPVDFHVVRGGIYESLRWRPYAQEVQRKLADNPLYENTVFLLQDDVLGQFANQLVGYGLLPRRGGVFRYRTRRGWGPPTTSFDQGVRHVVGTLDDSVNLAYLLGWKEIVLVGVDLYDSRYFYLDPHETLAVDEERATLVAAERNSVHGQRYDEQHNTVRSGVVRLMGEWREALAADGVRLSVYNPRSLLADELPIYERASRAVAMGAG